MKVILATRWTWLLALLLLTCTVLRADNKNRTVWEPVGNFGGSGADGVGAAKTDADGNLYVTGFFSTLANFQHQTLVSAGDRDLYLVKFGPRGQLKWIVQAGGLGIDEGTDLGFDARGNVYVSGWFSDSATFQSANGESETVNGQVHENVFVAKYSPAGRLRWVRFGGSLDFGTGNNRAWGLAVNQKTGTIYMTGYAQGTTYFTSSQGPDQPVSGPLSWHMFLVKYDTEGNFHWGITNAAAPNSLGYKVALDKQDSAYVVGWFEGDTTFSSNDGKEQTVTAFSGPVQSFPDYPDDAFLSKYDRYGNLKWVNHAGGYKAIANNVAASDDGRISITGLVGNVSSGQTSQAKTIITSQPGGADIDLGGGQLTNPYNWDLFIATYNGSGVLEGATRIGGANQDFGSGVAYDRDSNLYVTGVFAGSVDFGGQTLNGTAAHNSFVVKYRPRGHHGFANQLVWAQKIVGAGTLGSYQETGPRVWIEEGVYGDDHFGGSIVLAGDYQGTVSFGKYSFSSAGAEDVYLIRLNEIR